MSVINSVLKDLENRDNRFTPIELETTGKTAAPRRDRRPLLVIGLLTAALVLAGWTIVYQQARLQPVAETVKSPPTVIEVAPPADAELAGVVDDDRAVQSLPPPNEIRGLQIRETETGMRMEFVLGERVVAFLRERGENYFSYHLRDIESRVEAPLMRDNPWIVALDVSDRDGGVDISFETTAGVLVETRQARAEDDVLWAINLRQSEKPQPLAEQVVEPMVASRETVAAVVATTPEPSNPVISSGAPVTGANPEVVGLIADTPPTSSADSPVAEEVRLDIRSTNPEARSADRLAYAVELMNSRRHAEAETLLLGMLGGNSDIEVREHLLALYAARGQQDRYTRMARESMLAHPQRARFATEFARTLVQAKAWRDAIELLSRRARIDAEQHALLGASYQRLDQHEAAVRHYRLALENNATDARNWVGLAISLEHTAALAEALDAYRRAGRLGQLNERLQTFIATRSKTLQQVLN